MMTKETIKRSIEEDIRKIDRRLTSYGSEELAMLLNIKVKLMKLYLHIQDPDFLSKKEMEL